MKDDKKYLDLLISYINILFYNKFFPILLIILIYIVFKKSLIFLIFIGILILIFWIFKLFYIKKNKTDKYGILFIINNGELYNKNISSLVENMKFELQDNFEISVFNNNFAKKLGNDDKSRKIFFSKNYQMVINSFSLSGKENFENICTLINKDIIFRVPIVDKKTIENLQREFNLGFKKILKLSEKNSLNDITQNAYLMSLSIRYFTSIIYIIFNKCDLAEKQLLRMDFSCVDINDDIVKYLKNNTQKRFAEIYYSRLLKIMSSYRYLYDEDELNNFCNLFEKFEFFVKKENLLCDYTHCIKELKSKICFAKGKYYEALGYLEKLKKAKNINISALTLSRAFVEVNLHDIKGFETYKRFFKKSKYDEILFNDCIDFITNSMKNDIHDKNVLMLCKGILIYYWQNIDNGIELINISLNNINDQKMIDYLTVRFKQK